MSGAWRQDEDSTEDQSAESQPSTTQVGLARGYLFESRIIMCSVDACPETLKGKRTEWKRKEYKSVMKYVYNTIPCGARGGAVVEALY
jgi:hypothetical protein